MKELSIDLKSRAIALLEEGMSAAKVAERLLVGIEALGEALCKITASDCKAFCEHAQYASI